MGKKLWLIIVIIIAALLAIALLLNSKKHSNPLPMSIKVGISAGKLIAQAKSFEANGNLPQAQAIYQRLVNDFASSSEVMNWQKKAEDINIRLLFSPAIAAKSVSYEIKPGDTLNKIAREFKTTVELLRKSNNFAKDNIIPGRKIKVWTAPFNILIDKSQNTLFLKTEDEIFKTYIVSTGANNCTPTGTFKIANKLENPTWFKAGAVVASGSPENVLGTRWMGFDLAGYGIHGTTEPQNLGKQVTQGCVRLSNADVEELYTIIPVGTEVTVVD